MTTQGAKKSHLAPNITEETKKNQVDFFKTLSQPTKRPHKDLENAPRVITNSPSKSNINNKTKATTHHQW